MTGAYAVDALDADERSIFEEHLSVCPACAQEVRELQATAARLGSAVALPPPAGLRDRVLAEVGSVRQLPPVKEPRHASPAAIGSARERWARRWMLAAAACLAVLAVGLGAVATELYRDLQASRAAQARVIGVLSAVDARAATASGSGGTTGTVVVSRQRGELVFVSGGLPAVPRARTYQLWLIGPAGPRSAGLLGRSDGQTPPAVARDVADAESVGVTVEPAGGSKRPTTKPVLIVPLPPA